MLTSTFNFSARDFCFVFGGISVTQNTYIMAVNVIKNVLEQMGLVTFFQNFEKERIDEHMIESVSDSELSRLGLQTIG